MTSNLGPNARMIGQPGSRHNLNTPALLLDRAAFTRNLTRMSEIAAARGIKLRPHAKTHKCLTIARQQIAAGAIGVSCTVLHEAEIMAAGGIRGILLTSPVVTPSAIERLIEIARLAPDAIMVVADDPTNVTALADAAKALDHPLEIVVDFSSGYDRTGTATEAQAVALAKAIAALPSLQLRGLQAYAGNIQHIHDRTERMERAATLRAAVSRILALGTDEGVSFPIVTGAGTGTHDIDTAPFTEMQPGSYLFVDAQYAPVLEDGVSRPPFETSLYVQSAVVSTHAADYVTLDGGVKSMATDGPLPLVARGAAQDCTYAFFGDEYGKLFCPSQRPALGAKVELVTPHCDPTVNLHDVLHVVEGDTLVDIWPIDARGH